jgi:hypothetical protein
MMMIESGKTYGIDTSYLAKMRKKIDSIHGYFKKE